MDFLLPLIKKSSIPIASTRIEASDPNGYFFAFELKPGKPIMPHKFKTVFKTTMRKSFMLGIGLTCMCGCPYRLNLGPPGTIGEQRARAVVHDPYPDNDLGPPIVSGRPRGMDRPSSEPHRLQADNPYARKRQQGGLAQPYQGF